MAFIVDGEVLKSGLIIFRRGGVAHRNIYCRAKLPKDERYKTIALRTGGPAAARDQAFDADADIRFRIKHDIPVFNRPFRQVDKFIATLQRGARLGEVSHDSVEPRQSLSPGEPWGLLSFDFLKSAPVVTVMPDAHRA